MMTQIKSRIPMQPEATLVSPEGKLVRTSKYFESPAVIIIGGNGVAFDGWVFRTDTDLIESDIRWMAHQLEIVRDTQGMERAASLMAAIERLISTPRQSCSEGRDELPDTEVLPLPLAVTPDGRPVYAVEDLPELPIPKMLIIREEFLQVDGWHFRICSMTKPQLEWFVRQACRWCKEDPSPENRAQITGVIEALETLLKNGAAPGAE